MFHPHWRRRALASVDEHFDLLIVGGGINGCAVLLDAAQRGLRVLLVERGDLASGTSSRSSKLIHGGLRYLKEMQFGVTRESCRERDLQLGLSPHLVEPIHFVYPSYRGESPPGWKVDLGLWLYDRLTRLPEKHHRLSGEELAELAPSLPTGELDRALAYLDARTDDARLTLAVAATGFAYGGLILTRAAVEAGLEGADGELQGLVVRDLLEDRVHEVRASLVINAAGVWVDRVRELLGRDGRRLRPSRGSHLIFAAERLPLGAAVTLPSPDDGRPVFFIPHPEGVLVGTTDLFHDGPLEDPRPSRAEFDYLLRATAAAFPGDPPGADDVLGAFAGLRPVLDTHAKDPSAATREEEIWDERGLLSVAGGKLTTWRAIAEQVVDRAVELLPPERARRAAPCATAGTPLAGLAPKDLAARLHGAYEVETDVARALTRRLGALAWTACELAHDAGELRPLAEGLDLCAAEVRAHLRFGAAMSLGDLLLRRVRLAMWRPELARELLPHLRMHFGADLGWDFKRWDLEEERFAAEAEGWSPAGVGPGESA